MHTVILGVGNNLFSDEGVGVHAINYLRQFYPEATPVQLIDAGTLGFSLASYIHSDVDLIVIDAMQLHAPAGHVECFTGPSVEQRLQHSSSVHEVGVLDLLMLAHLTDSTPQHIGLIGVQPGSFDWGESLTANVQLALPRIGLTVEQLLKTWAADSNAADSNMKESNMKESKFQASPDNDNQQWVHAYAQSE